MLIYPTFNFVSCSWTESCWGTTRSPSPNHHRPTIMFHSMMDMLRYNAFSISNPTPWPTIQVKSSYHCFVIENHTFPIVNGPIFIPLSKPQACENMFTTQKRLRLLHLCTHPASLKAHLTMMSYNNFICFRSKLCCCRSSKLTLGLYI